MGVAVVTGVGRRKCIGAAAALRLGLDGWDVVMNRWRPADQHVSWHGEDQETRGIASEIEAMGRSAWVVDGNLEEPSSAEEIFRTATQLGPVEVLVLAHTHHVRGSVLEVSAMELDRHMAINVRASVLLIQAFARQHPGGGRGRIIALTSDAVVGNLGYGASKGALDRVVAAASRELGPLGITTNAINPGPNDTGWMPEELKREVIAGTPLGRVGTPDDTADLIGFLCSAAGGWMNGQLLKSNGGLATL